MGGVERYIVTQLKDDLRDVTLDPKTLRNIAESEMLDRSNWKAALKSIDQHLQNPDMIPETPTGYGNEIRRLCEVEPNSGFNSLLLPATAGMILLLGGYLLRRIVRKSKPVEELSEISTDSTHE